MGRQPNPVQPWERQPGESRPAWLAFQSYRDAGPARNIRAVAQEFGKSASLLGRWSSRHGWVARVAAWERHLDQQVQRRQEERAAAEFEWWSRRQREDVERDYQATDKVVRQGDYLVSFPATSETFEQDGKTVRVEAADPKVHRTGARMVLAGIVARQRVIDRGLDLSRPSPPPVPNSPLADPAAAPGAAGEPAAQAGAERLRQFYLANREGVAAFTRTLPPGSANGAGGPANGAGDP